jgi:hypothetical protein
MSRRELNADELGDKGENRFREICSDAKLVCNRSERDRTGWDFIVEFPFDFRTSQGTLDQRPPPISCHIQVKTLWVSSDQFAMRLSSAERLAKEHKPTFVYVFKVNEELEFVDAHLIHMLDENLGKVLRRLRREAARGATAINKSTITFSASKAGQPLSPTGEALRSALTTICGPEPDAYIEHKITQLKNMGFGKDRHTIQVRLLVPNKSDIVDVFLGVKEAKLTEFNQFETRFGIKLALADQGDTNFPFRITPIPADHCSVTFRGEEISIPAIFQADIIVPALPNLPSDERKSIIRSHFFEFQFHHRAMRFNSNENVAESSAFKISEWTNFFRMGLIVSKGSGSITFAKPDGKKFSLSLSSTQMRGNVRQYEYLLESAQKLEDLIEISGAGDQMVRLQDIENLAPKILATSALVSKASNIPPLIFKTERGAPAAPLREVEVLFVNRLEVGEICLAFYAVAKMHGEESPDSIKWTSHELILRKIVALPNSSEQYSAFLEQAKSTAALSRVALQPFERELPLKIDGF